MRKDFFYSKSAAALEFDKVAARVAAHAVGAGAKRRLAALLPTAEESEANVLYDECAAAQKLLIYKPSFPLAPVSESVAEALTKTEKEIPLSAEEIRMAGDLLRVSQELTKYYNEKKFETTALDDHFERLFVHDALRRDIERTFTPSGAVADDASETLASIRRAILRAGQSIKAELEHYIKTPEIAAHLRDPIVTLRSDRYVIPVRSDHHGEIAGLLHDTSASGGTLFIEPLFVIEQNNKIRQLEMDAQNEILKILARLSARIGEVAAPLAESYHALTDIDMIFARARYGLSNKCCIPTISSEKRIYFKNARHPLIDAAVMVPLTVSMDQDRDAIIVTGPNTGGKTVFLKTIGLLALMCKAGFPLPAESAEIFVFHRVFADIGDEQSIEQSLSTFSSHMRNIKNIIASSGENDLVLFDELGSGTDPREGAALAVSIIRRVRTLGAYVAATTHYGELKSYALTTPGVANASFAFDLKNLSPTYELQLGIPGRSYAFEISKHLGLDEKIIEDAKKQISGDEKNIEQVIAALNEQRNAYEKRLAEMKEREKELTAQKAALAKEKQKSTQGAENRIAAADQKAKAIVENAKRQAEFLMSELKDLRDKMDKTTYQELKGGARRAAGKLQYESVSRKREAPVSGTPLAEPPKAGDTVYVPMLGKNAAVESVSGRKAYVISGGVRMNVDIAALCVAAQDPAEKKNAVRFQRERFNAGAATELDIRGMNVLEATEEIDRFLDGAILAKLASVSIIHGKGTGVLRAGVHAHLKGHAAVKTFRLGSYHEGDTGVTIVELK